MDEKTLVESARKGSVCAFNQLVLLHQSIAYNVAYRILNNPDAAADATQDAFLSAFNAMGTFRGGSFKSWLLRIVTNACYNQLRRKQRGPVRSLDNLCLELDRTCYLEDEAEQPDEYVERYELNCVIQAGIAGLPIEQATVLVLSDVQGMSYTEIAETLDLPPGTVKSRLSRGRAKLRDFLAGKEAFLPSRYQAGKTVLCHHCA